MEVRSKAAAAAAAVVPFHCVICFDEFNQTERPPMVLPCGHTFVCLPCSKKIKRCMECREPLFLMPPQPITPPLNARQSPMYRQGGRYSPTAPMTPPHTSHYNLHHQQQPTVRATPTALPIPRNLVLLSMMEAAERQTKLESERCEQESAEKTDQDEKKAEDEKQDENDEEEEEAYDLNRIIGCMATLSGPCGTYVIREPDGLKVLPSDPRLEPFKGTNVRVRVSSGSSNADHTEVGDTDLARTESVEIEDDQPGSITLNEGQTVQVVDFSEDGVVKLARNTGFIVASHNQLVKVGGPLDKSCRLEGLLDTVTSRGRDLQKELDEHRMVEESLCQQISLAMEETPTHPIISAPREPEPDEVPGDRSNDASEVTSPVTPTAQRQTDSFHLRTPDGSPGQQMVITGQPDSIGQRTNDAPYYPNSPNSIDNADLSGTGLPRYRPNFVSDDENLADFALGCGAAFLGVGVGESTELAGELFAPDSHHLINRLDIDDARGVSSAGAIPSLPPTHSSDGPDFRTGFSGHGALAHYRNHVQGSPNRSSFSFSSMSSHRGIGHARGPVRNSSPSASPNPPQRVQGAVRSSSPNTSPNPAQHVQGPAPNASPNPR